jgi:hypothetical protein
MTKPNWILLVAGLVLAPLGPLAAQTLGRSSPAALASARAKEGSMREPQGPASVTLSPDEMASLVQANLDQNARGALDSVRVRLQPGRLALEAMIVTSQVGSDILGPLSYMLGPLEPLVVAGPARATQPGVITWQPDSVVIRSFAFPQAAIPRLVSRLTGSTDGTVPIAVPHSVTQIFITPSGVTFVRRSG